MLLAFICQRSFLFLLACKSLSAKSQRLQCCCTRKNVYPLISNFFQGSNRLILKTLFEWVRDSMKIEIDKHKISRRAFWPGKNHKYCISSYSFRGNYSFLNLEIQRSQYIRPKVTVHKGAETIQGRKLFKGGNYMRKYGTFILSKILSNFVPPA